MILKHTLKYLALAALALAFAPRESSAVNVSLELSLLVDESSSIDNGDFLLQRNGYANAFRSAGVHNAILALGGNAASGGMAVNFVQWDANQKQSIGWTRIWDVASANAFADVIEALPRFGVQGTAPGSAINFAYPLFDNNGFESARQVIDVSGDGVGSAGANTLAARNAALAAGIDRINGLPINGGATLNNWYAANIQGGTNSFTLPANDFAAFASTVQTKIVAEIRDTTPNNVPEGGRSLALLGLALAGLTAARRFTNRQA
jgi:hypothetical protein